MSEEEQAYTCPSCRVEIDPICLERCTGCGVPFPEVLQVELRAVYSRNVSDIRLGAVRENRSVSAATDTDELVPVAPVATMVIDPVSAFSGPSGRQRWSDSLGARVFLRAGIGLSIWSMLVAVLGQLALIPALVGMGFCILSLLGPERRWALAGVVFSIIAVTVIFYVMAIQQI